LRRHRQANSSSGGTRWATPSPRSNALNTTIPESNITGTVDGKQRAPLVGLLSNETKSGFTVIPYAVNAVDPTRIAIGLKGMYESKDRGDTVSVLLAPTAAQAALPNFAGVDATGYSKYSVKPSLTAARTRMGRLNRDVMYFSRADVIYVRTGATGYYDRESRRVTSSRTS
jgi:hypothetical protein